MQMFPGSLAHQSLCCSSSATGTSIKEKQLKEKIFILTWGFRGLSLWSTDSIVYKSVAEQKPNGKKHGGRMEEMENSISLEKTGWSRRKEKGRKVPESIRHTSRGIPVTL